MKKMLAVTMFAAVLGAGSHAGGIHPIEKKEAKASPGAVSPFLIRQGLPHMTGLLKQHWDDPGLALTSDQKTRLLAIRRVVLITIRRLKPQIVSIETEIIRAGRTGSDGAHLKKEVNRLAALKAEATVAHLDCIARTKAVLSPKQTRQLLSGLKNEKE